MNMYIISAKLFWAIKFENKIKLKNDELENNVEQLTKFQQLIFQVDTMSEH